MITAGIIGANGYTGIELVRLLQRHPQVKLLHAGSRSLAGSPYAEEIGSLRSRTELDFRDASIEKTAADCDVVFLALPHGIASVQVTSNILERSCIIDLGADYRLKSRELYEQWYGVEHGSPQLLEQAVYGLPEIVGRKAISEQNLIANPGCYTTASILSTAPIARAGIGSIPYIIDAKSGVSGAGRQASQGLMFGEVNESIKAYKLKGHRHTPEIEQMLGQLSGNEVSVQFTPHLVPMNRGILTTTYIHPTEEIAGQLTEEKLRGLYENMYGGETFIRLLPEGVFPETRWVRGSNYVDIGLTYDQRTGIIIVVAALDNLVKGAAGQAVQNMNIRFGFEEVEGLGDIPLFP